MTPEERNTVIAALEIGRDAAAEVAARYHDAMAGYRKHAHDKMDDDVARLDAALAIMRRDASRMVYVRDDKGRIIGLREVE